MRDIRNLTGTRSEEIVIFGGASTYNKYINSDFAFIKGLVLSFRSSLLNGFSGNLDYTYQIARGTASDPSQARNSLVGGAMPEVHLISLNWDQTHTLNTSLNYSIDNKGFSLISQFGSGLPYTPEFTENISSLIQNSGKKPITWNVDMQAYYILDLFDRNINCYIRDNYISNFENPTKSLFYSSIKKYIPTCIY